MTRPSSMIFTLALLSAPILTVQLPHLRGSSNLTAVSPRSLRGAAMSQALASSMDMNSSMALSLAQTDAHVQRAGGRRTSIDEEGTCDASCALAYLARADSAVSSEDDAIDFLNPGRLERALAAELNRSLAASHAVGRPRELQQELRGLFAALPKNPSGGLGHAATNYAVHQWFVRRRQWHLRNDETVDSLAPGEALRARVPQQLQRLLEQERGELGIGLRELASLVATIEHLIDGDLIERLKAAYMATGLSHGNDSVDTELVAEAIMTQMSGLLSLRDRSGFGLPSNVAKKDRKENEQGFPFFHDLKKFVVDALHAFPVRDGAITFQIASDVARQADRKLADVLKGNCAVVKDIFSAFPDGKTGRVSLAHMHKRALEGAYQLGESTAYLKNHGMLDEYDPEDVRVFVPNLIYGPSNCAGGTSFLEVCCPNACEALIEHVERGVAAPAGTPAALVALVNLHSLAADLDGGSVSPALRSRLESAAAKSGGVVPVHGRVFAEWLNNALPLDCPMPHAWDFVGDGRADAEVQNTIREFNVVATEETVATASELRNDALAASSPHRAKAVSI